eukprot:TRINITY_DN84784_c0_g1_i1.p1 TRINITY_DN84784_c0_g1~~TRINITY_DN84784_c0_g1_i1.p1  ORF type:complete len:273 (+),score=36.09 TRINITY_DN84784_c0_g1_i1:43-861(+)
MAYQTTNCRSCSKHFRYTYNGTLYTRCPHCHYRTCCGAVPATYPCQHGAAVGEFLEEPSIDPADSIFALTERLFAAPDKDVTFVLTDGEELAHGLILSASSSVFAEMLSAPMQEKATRRIELPDVDCATMRIFLRLLYTGHANEEDWKNVYEPKHAEKLATNQVPILFLLQVTVLTKKYIVSHLIDLTTQTLIRRIKATLQADSNVDLFDEALGAAIASDLRPVITAAVEAAKSSTALRAKYDAKTLRPEVQYELSAFWPPSQERAKRVRLA